MAYKQRGGVGTLVIDRQFRDIGRIKKSSGTNDPAMVDKYNQMLTNLSEQCRLDVLHGIKNGSVTIPEVYQYWKSQELNRLPTVQHIIKLDPAMFEWLEGYAIKEVTRRTYRFCIRHVINVKPDGVETDLPEMVKEYRRQCLKEGITRHFNQARAVILSYLSDRYNKHHGIYIGVASVKTIPTAFRKLGKGHRVGSIMEFLEQIRNKKAREIFWTMCITGMGLHEYCGDWEVKDNAVYIHGTKRQSRDRVVPYLYPLPDPSTKPTLADTSLRDFIRVASDTLQIYDGRRTFAHWCEQASIPYARIKMYLGHSMRGNVTNLYLYHDVADYVVEDAERLRSYIESEKLKWLESKKGKVNPKFAELVDVA